MVLKEFQFCLRHWFFNGQFSFAEELQQELVVVGPKAATGGVLQKRYSKSFAKFKGRHLCQKLFFNKVEGLGLQIY